MIASAKASVTAGFVAESLAVAIASGEAPASSLLEMQLDAAHGCNDQRIGQSLNAIGREKGGRQPSGLVGMPHDPSFAQVAGPKNVLRRRTGSLIADHQARNPPQEFGF